MAISVAVQGQPVPRRALAISIAALVLPVVVVYWCPDWTSTGAGMLIWLAALIPAFLLSYYRGLAGVATALAGGMAVIVATQVSIVAFRIAEPDWGLLAMVVGVYLAISVGIGVLAEVFRRDRRAAEELALVDRLTGLANRRHADLTLAQEFAAAVRGAPLAVALFDIDHFKTVNDRFGHPVGDMVLRDFGDILRINTRRENLSARFGGEEFISILRDASVEDAITFAQRILNEMRARPYQWGNVTVSAGVAVYDPSMATFEFLVGAADRALYRAKQGGRDNVALDAPRRARPATPPSGLPATGRPVAQAPLVWIVDDDDAVRTVVRRVLGTRRYRTWDTGAPEEAIARIGSVTEVDRPTLVVADVIMPSMTGPRMMDQIHVLAPDLPVIYMSGYAHGDPLEGESVAGVEFLQKPLTKDGILAAVSRATSATEPV